MKTIQLLILSCLFANAINSQNNWRWGLGVSSVGNSAMYVGGMKDANARFHQRNFETGVWSVYFRNDFKERWSFETGLQFSQIGFQYAIAENYSLLNKHKQFTSNQISSNTISIPLTLIYRFKPNCNNYRWFVGAGLSLVGVGSPSVKEKNVNEEGVTSANTNYISQSVNVSSAYAFNGHLMFGIEKQRNSGRMWSLGIIVNGGLTPLMNSTVNYSIDNVSYNHKFSNYGNYAGLRFAYFFKKFNCSSKTFNSTK
jgi:hypothetical protein